MVIIAINTDILTYIIGAALLLALLIILIFAMAIYRLTGKKEDIDNKETDPEEVLPIATSALKPSAFSLADITDEDMMAAALVATIDYAEETKKDVRLLSIRQIG